MSVSVRLSYSPVAVATHFIISIPFLPVAASVAAQINQCASGFMAEKTDKSVNACLMMGIFHNIKKAVLGENSTITDFTINYCDGMANIRGSLQRFNAKRASREFLKLFSKWDAIKARSKAGKYCSLLGFKQYTELLTKAIKAADTGIPGNIDIYILTRNKNPSVAMDKESSEARKKRVAKQAATIKTLTELQATVKKMLPLKAGTTPYTCVGTKYDNIGAYIISKLLNVPSEGSYIVADQDKIKKAVVTFTDRLKKKKKPEKALWHLVTMAICSGNVTAAAVGAFAAKIDDSTAIASIKALGGRR
jgi:hypothetical protein